MANLDGATPETGPGGETHQTVDGDDRILTTQQGIPVADDQNTLTVGQRGPSVLEDFHFREKLFHFDGTDGALLDALRAELEGGGALLELVAPTVGGIVTSTGDRVPTDRNVGGGSSVLFDAVALRPNDQGAAALARDPAAQHRRKCAVDSDMVDAMGCHPVDARSRVDRRPR